MGLFGDNESLAERLLRQIPGIDRSRLFIVTVGDDAPTDTLCLNLGAALLLDAPIIVIAPHGARVPANLKRCAATIVERDPRDRSAFEDIRKAIVAVLENDRRCQT